MPDSVGGMLERGQELYYHKESHQIFGFHRKDEIKVDQPVRKHDRKCHQNTKDGTRRSDGGDGGINREDESEDSRSDAGQEIVFHEFPAAPGPFDLTAKHPQGKHVEKNVEYSPVKKHVGDQLPDVSFLNQDRGQSENMDQFGTPQVLQNENSYVDQKQVLDCFSDPPHPETKGSVSIIIAHIFYLSETRTDYLNLITKRAYPLKKTFYPMDPRFSSFPHFTSLTPKSAL